MVWVGISELKVLADVVIEGNSTTNKQTNRQTNKPAYPSLRIWPTYLPSSAYEWNQGCFLCYCFLWDPNSILLYYKQMPPSVKGL